MTRFILKFGAGLLLSVLFFLLLSIRKDLPAEVIKQKYWLSGSHFIAVNGHNLHVRIKGTGKPIFLLHGSFSSLHTWDKWQQALSPYFMTISVDLPGHGLTGPDSLARYSIQEYSELILQLAKQLELPQFHLAGNSMGGAVAMQIASTNPDRVLSLNLIDSSGVPLAEEKLGTESEKPKKQDIWIIQLAKNPWISPILLKCTPRFLFAMNLKEVYGDERKLTPEVLDRYYELMLREGNRKATLDRLSLARSYQLDFEKMTMPVLILWGEKDRWIPVEQASILQKQFESAQLIVFEEAGHVPMEEIPTETVKEYLKFLGVRLPAHYLEDQNYMTYEY